MGVGLGMRVSDADKLLEEFFGATKGTVESLLGAEERVDVNKRQLMREHLRIMANHHLELSRRVESGHYNVSETMKEQFRAYREKLESHTWLTGTLNDWVFELTQDWQCSACQESVALRLEDSSGALVAVCKACESLTPLSSASQLKARELLNPNSSSGEGV